MDITSVVGWTLSSFWRSVFASTVRRHFSVSVTLVEVQLTSSASWLAYHTWSWRAAQPTRAFPLSAIARWNSPDNTRQKCYCMLSNMPLWQSCQHTVLWYCSVFSIKKNFNKKNWLFIMYRVIKSIHVQIINDGWKTSAWSPTIL